MFRIVKATSRLARLSRRPEPDVGKTPHDVVFAENKWRLLRFRGPEAPTARTPILMVPSLINRWYVLDLMPGRSFVEYLVDEGHDVFVIDWGTPGPEDRYLRFEDVVIRSIGRAIRRATELSGAPRAHLLGYCMGGTLATIHAAVAGDPGHALPNRVASLTSLAGPVSFHDGGLLSTWTNAPTFDADALVDAFGNVPWPLLVASFQLLKPTLTLSKGLYLMDQAMRDGRWTEDFLAGYLAKEKWANDNVSLPGEVFRTWVKELYQRDGLVQGTLRLDGRRVDLGHVTCPTHVISFEHDYIVPKEAAAPLAELVGAKDVTHSHLNGGHVSSVVSKSARKRLWPALSQWWLQATARPAAPTELNVN
ncbi:MAG: alpha/beta fold hydrolase [Myxococcota bacterium]